ncbi:unnamed protein product [Effrenium voratum]|nr:unnamed protein product [Effrenium voratum]
MQVEGTPEMPQIRASDAKRESEASVAMAATVAQQQLMAKLTAVAPSDVQSQAKGGEPKAQRVLPQGFTAQLTSEPWKPLDFSAELGAFLHRGLGVELISADVRIMHVSALCIHGAPGRSLGCHWPAADSPGQLDWRWQSISWNSLGLFDLDTLVLTENGGFQRVGTEQPLFPMGAFTLMWRWDSENTRIIIDFWKDGQLLDWRWDELYPSKDLRFPSLVPDWSGTGHVGRQSFSYSMLSLAAEEFKREQAAKPSDAALGSPDTDAVKPLSMRCGRPLQELLPNLCARASFVMPFPPNLQVPNSQPSQAKPKLPKRGSEQKENLPRKARRQTTPESDLARSAGSRALQADVIELHERQSTPREADAMKDSLQMCRPSASLEARAQADASKGSLQTRRQSAPREASAKADASKSSLKIQRQSMHEASAKADAGKGSSQIRTSVVPAQAKDGWVAV